MSTKLYVGNLPEDTKEKELKDIFQSFGDVTDVAVLRGYGFVHFDKQDDASAALDSLDGSEFMRARLLVQFARTKGHGYGRGSGPPRPRGPPPRGSYRDSYRRNDRDGYRDNHRDGHRDGGGYRDSHKESSGYRDGHRDRDSYRESGRDYRDSRDRDRGGRDNERSSGSRYGDRDRDSDRYDYLDNGRSKYSEYSSSSKARSRSPIGSYKDSYQGSSGYHRDRESRDSGSRRW